MSWHPDSVMQLIELVKGFPILYDSSEVNYKSKVERMKLLNYIADNMSTMRPGTTAADVRKKWNMIRSTYSNEKKKVEDSRRSGVSSCEVYQPSLYYYKELMFLDPVIKVRDSKSTLDIEDNHDATHTLVINSVDVDDNFFSFATTNVEPEFSNSVASQPSCSNGVASQPSCSNGVASQPSCSNSVETPQRRNSSGLRKKNKRRRDDEDDAVNIALQNATSALQRLEAVEDDNVMIYCRYLATRLRELTNEELFEARHAIENMLYVNF